MSSAKSDAKSDSDSKSSSSRKNGRMGKPKVRTGCITCKVRRIKCDEGKPFCGRCTSTGRQCDGYGSKNKGESQVYGKQNPKIRSSAALPMSFAIKFIFSKPIPDPIFDFPDTASQELRSLEIFRCATANKLSEWLTENFWKYQIPQCGAYEPSLRHAMIAVATIHELFTVMNSALPGDPRLDTHALDAQRRFADKHHSIAMSELRTLLDTRPESSEIALINCVLFVVLDFVRGNFSTAVLHLHSGMEILSRWRKELDFSMMTEGSLESNILEVFHHLSFQTAPEEYHLDIDSAPDYGPDPTSFNGLLGAQLSIEHLSQQSLRLIRLGAVLSLNPQDSVRIAALELEVKGHTARLNGWLHRLDMLLLSLGSNLTMEEEETIHELRIMHLSSLTWIGAGLGCTSAEATERFHAIVDLADRLQTWRQSLPSNRTKCGWESCILPPIYYVATKCEEFVLKRKAIALLMKTSPHLGYDERLGCLNKTLRPYTHEAQSQLSYYNARTTSDTVILREEKTACDKRIAMEVELQPNTQLVDLILTPGEDGRAWEVRRNISLPTGSSYFGLC